MAATYFILKAGIAPPDLASQPLHAKLTFWSWVVDLGLKRKDWELARGLNAKGEPLPGIAPATRKHRTSAMTPSGRGDPSAPYLMPGRGLSRTRSLLTGKPHADYAEFFWRYDAYTGDQWGRVLAWHAARGKAYDVVGLSPAGIAVVAQQAQKQWRQWLVSGNTVDMQRGQRAAATGLDGGRTEPLGRTNLTYTTFGIGGSKEQAQKAIDEGRSSGFRTPAEWEAYFRSKRPVGSLLNPSTTSYSVRQGNSNVLLQATFGGTPKPPPAVLARAAMPPVAPAPKPKPKPTPKPAPPVAMTPPLIPPSTATIVYGGKDSAERTRSQEAASAVFGNIPADRFASIIGAPDGAKVKIYSTGSRKSIDYEVKHPSLTQMLGGLTRTDEELQHNPYALYVKKAERGKGVGASIHGRRVQYGAEHGVSRLRIVAVRGKDENGYIVWPVFGYDGPLPDFILKDLPDQLKGRTTIQELLADEGGQKWWKKNGEGVRLTFDLKPGSKSILRWMAYQASRLLNRGK